MTPFTVSDSGCKLKLKLGYDLESDSEVELDSELEHVSGTLARVPHDIILWYDDLR